MGKVIKVSPQDITRVCALFATTVRVLAAQPRETDKREGAVIHFCTDNYRELLLKREGTAPEDKFLSYETNAPAKTQTLHDHPTHQLSFQSRVMNTGPHPGGARFPNGLLLAISGFTWQEDEIAVLWIGWQMRWITLNEALNLAKLSQGHSLLFTELFQQFNRTHTQQAAA